LQSDSREFQTPQSGIIRSTLQSGSTKFSTRPSEVLFSNLAIKKKKKKEEPYYYKIIKEKDKFKPCHKKKKKQEKPTVKKDEIKK
jgi:hypothetical protein